MTSTKSLLFIYFALVILVFSSCQPSGGKEATVSGMNGCIANPAACNNTPYQQNQGYYPYGYNSSYGYNYNYSQYYNQPFTYYGNNAYLCNCPAGTIPTYNSSAGLGCVRSATASFTGQRGHSGHGGRRAQKAYGYFYLGWYNNSWYSTPYISTYYYNQSSCYSGAVQSCLLGTASQTCPAGYLCRASGSSTTLGLCTAASR